MPNTNSSKFIQIPVTQPSAEDLIQHLSEDIVRLHQVIDEMTNTLTMQKELIQQLRDEIARLKGQKPKPNIRPSKPQVVCKNEPEARRKKRWKTAQIVLQLSLEADYLT